MSGLNLRVIVLTATCLATPLSADPLPEEPVLGGRLLLPGRLPWGTTALPTGEILAPCEDQTLTVLGDQAQVIATWKAPYRFSGPVSTGPRTSGQLVAAPQVTGRFDLLIWDPRTRSLASTFAAQHDAEAVTSAWSVSGTVFLGWRDGMIEAWAPNGSRVWQATSGRDLKFLLVDEGLGLYAVGTNLVTLFDSRGRETARWELLGSPRGVLQTLSGDLYVWTETGLWKQQNLKEPFRRMDPASLLGVAVDRQDRLILVEPERIRRLGSDGTVLSLFPLPRQAVTGPALDDRGRVVVGTKGGMEVWTYDGRLLQVLDTTVPASAPQMGDRGQASWSAGDWQVHVWRGFRWPPFGWPHEGGSPGRGFSARRPSSLAVRATGWTDDPEFGYFFQLVSSGEDLKQREVLDRFEAKAAIGNLTDTWPFANLILLKLARSGLTDLLLDPIRVKNSWPQNRLRAYTLLAQTAGPEDREDLMAVLQKEYDPSVVAQGALALARSGWDGDGRLLRFLAELQTRMVGQTVVADAVIDAARLLWQTNGRSADPVLVPLVSAVFQGPYPRAVKQKAQKFFQDLMEAP